MSAEVLPKLAAGVLAIAMAHFGARRANDGYERFGVLVMLLSFVVMAWAVWS